MSRKNFFQDPLQPEPALGMDSTSPLQVVPPGFVRSASNARVGLVSGYVKRQGYASVMATPWDTRSITAGIEYKNSALSRITYLFGTDGSGSGGKIGYVSGGAVTEVSTGLSGSARASFIQFGDQLFFFNGSDAPIVIADTTAKQMGITPPIPVTQDPTGVVAGGGSPGLGAGSYVWAYSYYNSTTGAESSLSGLLVKTGVTAGQKCTLTFTAGSSATANEIRIWRTYANGQELYLEDTVAISATSYISQIADSSLGSTRAELDNTRVTEWSGTPQYPQIAGRRIWLRTGKNEARYSKIGQAGAMPESFPASNVVDVTGTYGAADDLIGIGKAGDKVIILKERSVGTADEIGYPDSAAAQEMSFHIYRELSSSVACVSHWAAVEVLGECIFLGRDNIYGTRGEKGDLRKVADSISATIRSLGFSTTQITKVSAINDVAKSEVRFQVFLDSSTTVPAYCLVGRYDRADGQTQFRWTWDTPGTNTTTHPGIRAACYFDMTDSSSGSSLVYFGGVANGKIYQLNSGDSDDGLGIYYEIVDRPRSGPSSLADKLWKEGGFYAAGDGSAYSLEVSSIYDLSGAEENVKQISLASPGFLWDTGLWDTDSWGTNASPKRRYQTHRKAQHRQIVFRQISANAPVAIFSWVNTGSVFRIY